MTSTQTGRNKAGIAQLDIHRTRTAPEKNESFRTRNYLLPPSPSSLFTFVNSSDCFFFCLFVCLFVLFFLTPGRVIGSGAFGEVHLAEVDGIISNENSKFEAAPRPRLSLKRDLRRASTLSVKGPIKVAVKTLKGNEIYLRFTSDRGL